MCNVRRSCLGKKPSKGVIPYSEFMSRIEKSLYYGPAVSEPLAGYTSELFSEVHRGYSLHRLDKETVGNIYCPPSVLIMTLIYLERLQESDPNFIRNVFPSELFIVAVIVSTKIHQGYDEQPDLEISDWAAEIDVTTEHIKKLELDFLKAIDWNIHVSTEEFFEKLSAVEKVLAQKEGLRRGWLTYTELQNLLPSFTLAKFIFSNFTVMAVSYAATVVTLAGAFFLANHVTKNCTQIKERLGQNALSNGDNQQNVYTFTSDTSEQTNETVNNDLETDLECLKLDVSSTFEKNISLSRHEKGFFELALYEPEFKDKFNDTRIENCSWDWLWSFAQKNLHSRIIWIKII